MTTQVDEASKTGPFQQAARAATSFSLHHPFAALAISTLITLASVAYTATGLSFRTDRSDLINPKASYQQRWLKYTREFGDSIEDLVVVVEAPDADEIRQVLDEIGPQVQQDTKLFTEVLYKVETESLLKKKLYYLSPEQMGKVLQGLQEASQQMANGEGIGLSAQFEQLSRQLAGCVKQKDSPEADEAFHAIVDQTATLMRPLMMCLAEVPVDPTPAAANPLAQLIGSDTSPPRYVLNKRSTMGFLTTRLCAHTKDFSGSCPGIDRMRELIAVAVKQHPQARIGLTGIPVLESDEMRDSQRSMTWASIWSFVGVAVLMIWGFRAIRYPLMALIVLLVGMAWSFGCAAAIVGHLNILSVSFAAMLVGLGIDYAIVYLACYIELRQDGEPLVSAVCKTAERMGPGIMTASATAAITFFSAVLTDFTGVAELGLIGGSGILVCTVAVFLLLPAMIVLWDKSARPVSRILPLDGRLTARLSVQHPIFSLSVWGLIIVGLIWGATRLHYDGNLLHMQADGLESVQAMNRIVAESDNSLLFAVSLADTPEQALELKRRFEGLPTVGRVEEVASMLPQQSAAQTAAMIAMLRESLNSAAMTPPTVPDVNPSIVGKQLEQLDRLLAVKHSDETVQLRVDINKFLDFLDQIPLNNQVQMLNHVQGGIVSGLMAQFNGLRNAANASPVELKDLPSALSSRFVSPGGKWLLRVYPKTEIWDGEPLEKFVADVRSVDRDATGTPLQTYEASRAIRTSYEQAGLYSLVAVFLFLFVDFRNLRDTILALLPPVLGLLLTFGILGWTGHALNPANLILLPLILGLGVDGGVHVVHDFRRQRGRYQMSLSTLNALFLTTTTSMVGFGSMMIAEHRGLFSLGLVLTIGVVAYLMVSLFVLPPLLVCLSGVRSNANESDDEEGDAGPQFDADTIPLPTVRERMAA